MNMNNNVFIFVMIFSLFLAGSSSVRLGSCIGAEVQIDDIWRV